MQSVATPTLLEREEELDAIAGLADAAAAGRGRVALVEGPPGIGKTRLLDAIRQEAADHDMVVLSARASELDRDFPFGVVRQLFEPVLAGADPDRRAAMLHGAAAPAAALLESGSPEPAAAGPDPSLQHFHALYWLAANLAESAPLALVVDDLHWADASSLRFLEFLVPRIEGLSILLALATRDSEPGADRRPIDAVATDALTTVLRPGPLSERAVTELVVAEFDESPDERFCGACRAASGGNPFLLRELLRELEADGVAPAAASVPLVGQLAPPTVARAVLLRLARLGDEASALARAVAVLGDDVPLRRAATLAGLPEEPAAALAAELARAGILAGSRPLAFAHPVLRSSVYGDIEPGERAEAHGRAAALLTGEGAEPDAVAVHLLVTEPGGDPEVAETLSEAATRAVARGAAAVAASCLRRALAEPPRSDDRGPLMLRLAAAELHSGAPAAAAEHFEEGVRITADPRTRARRAWDHSVALQAVGRADESWRLRERAIEEVAEVDPELALSLEASLIASAVLARGRLKWARERLDRHRVGLGTAPRSAAGPPAASPAHARLLATMAIVDSMFGDQPADAIAATAERALASGGLADDSSGFVPFFCAVEALWCADRIEPARRALDRALEGSRRRGSAIGFASMSGWRGLLHARQGELADAEADARSCAELSVPHGWFGVAPPMLGYVLDVLVTRGELEDAARLLADTGTADRDVDGDFTFYPMLHARARLRAARGDGVGGRADFEVLDRRPGRWNTYLPFVPALLVAPELAGPPEEERERAERMLREGREWGTPRAIGMALRALGLVEGGTRGIEILEEAVAVLASSPARLEHARALADLGAALRRANRRSDARGPLREALDLADACGARPLVEQVRHELRAAGGRPRRTRTSGVESLTASERRIAAMAAEGLSNPEIAQALFVTKKTVEAHLGNAYRKLGVRSRSELPAALG